MNPFWRIFFKWVETTNQIGVGNFSVHFQPSNQPVPVFVVTWQMLPTNLTSTTFTKKCTEEMVLEKVSIPEPEACVCVSVYRCCWAFMSGSGWPFSEGSGEGGRCFAPIRFLGWKNFHQAKLLTPPEVQYDPVRFWKMDGIGRSLRLILFCRALFCSFSEFSEC